MLVLRSPSCKASWSLRAFGYELCLAVAWAKAAPQQKTLSNRNGANQAEPTERPRKYVKFDEMTTQWQEKNGAGLKRIA